MAELQNTLPSGWDCQYDKKSGRYYFINHYTKTTTWEDPRLSTSKHRHPTGIHASSAMSSEYIPLQDLSNVSRSSPRTARVQDSTLSASASNTEEAVAKISAMFPTVSDTHIRLLLKKYMKSIFPKADETMILDILSGNDNNIQKASDVLKEMGYEKRDSAKLCRHQHTPKLSKPKEQTAEAAPVVPPKAKTLEDKKLIKAQLQEKYKDIPEQVITIALESVDYDTDRAIQILQIMVQEENDKQTTPKPSDNQDEITEVEDSALVTVTVVPLSQSRQSLKSLLKTEKSDYSLKDTGSYSRVIEEQSDSIDDNMGHRSQYLTNTSGANRSLVKGANQELLLEDYIKWQGPQPVSHRGSLNGLAKGPNSAFLSARTYKPCGPNPELRKGPKFGSAKGSIFSQLKDAVVGESRGK